MFPENCVYMRWNYDDPEKMKGNEKILKWYSENNLKAMAATSGQTMWPMMPRDESKISHIRAFCKMANKYNLDGILCTFWDDGSPHFETYRRGVAAFAQYSWSAESKLSKDEFKKNYRHRTFSLEAAADKYAFEDFLELSIAFWDNALLDKGTRLDNNFPNYVLITLPEFEKPGVWSRKYSERLKQAKKKLNATRL